MQELAKRFGEVCSQHKLKVATAESCTAGLIASTIASIASSSSWLECGFIVYTPQAKNKMLGVSFDTIEKFNITSREVASEMATGALLNSGANLSIAVTGVAGPTGGTADIPVGTVCIAIAYRDQKGLINVQSSRNYFKGDRNTVREGVVKYCLDRVISKYE